MPVIEFCKMVAEKITSEHNQHVTLMIYAPTGAGKSWTGLAIGELVALFVSQIKGGTPQDYFTVDNIAIITQQEIIRLLKGKLDVRYSVIGFDDIGVGWNARKFMDDFNTTMNDIYQTFRTRNCFLYVTLPDPRLIDVVPRDMVKYVLEVYRSHHDDGYVECKLFEVAKNMRSQKKRYPYRLDLSGNRIVRDIVYAPSPCFTLPYEKRRSEIEKMNSDNAIKNLEALLTKVEEENKEKLAKIDPEATQLMKINDVKAEITDRLIKEFHLTQKEASALTNINPRTYRAKTRPGSAYS